MARSRDRSDRARGPRGDRGGRRHSRDRDNNTQNYHDRDSYRRNDNRRYYRSSSRGDRSRGWSPARGGDRKRYREPSPVRDRYQGRERFYEPRDHYNDREPKRLRQTDSYRAYSSSRRGSTPGRLTPRSYDDRSNQDSSPHDRSRPTSRGNADQDEEEVKKAERLARLEALKKEEEAGIGKPASTKSEAIKDISKGAVPKFASSLLKPSRPAYAADQETPKRFDTVAISKRAAASLAKYKAVGQPSAALRANMAQLEAMKAADASSDLAVTDDSSKRKLQELPADTSSPAGVNDDADDDLIASDDETHAAARKSVQKRALDAQDTLPTDRAAPPSTDTKMKDEEDEVDALDAFMNNLEQPKETEVDLLKYLRGGKNRARRTFNSDDEDVEIDAIGLGLEDADAPQKKRVKAMPTVNHAEMNYEDFRKNFYHESTELSGLTDEELDVIRAELENITVTGNDVPKPIQTFPQGGFGTQILDVINELQFEKPTPIQSQALPAIMSGRDTLAVAKTGSGKTMAYLLPMFRHVKDQRPLENLEGPIALIVVPTRELAVQVHKECKPFLAKLNLRAALCYGGPPISDHIAELKRGAEIVVATPGRMIDLLTANSGRVTNLHRVTYLVLDEADRMFDLGFEKQIKVFNQNIRPDKQTVLFSATLPQSMEHFALRALKDPVQITVGGRSIVGDEIEQIVEVVNNDEKFGKLLHYLGDNHKKDDGSRSLIFVERQGDADALHAQLLKKGYIVHSIHGGRDQSDRDHFISDFKRGIVDVLVATSVAARGLDVKQLNLVVNFDCPNHHEDYVHRVGRTGRAGNTGKAVTFVTPQQDRWALFLVKALTESKRESPQRLQELADSFQKKVDAGEQKTYTSGFGGHGIDRLQVERDNQRALVAKKYGTDGNEVEPDQIEKKDEKIAEVKETQPTSVRPEYEKLLRDALVVTKTEDAPPPTSTRRGHNTFAGNTALERAAAAAASVTNRLGAKGLTRPDTALHDRGPDAGAYQATMRINDLPQEARWAVTQRQKVVKVLENTGVSITTKGIFYPPGKEPQLGELPKLYCLIEGDTTAMVESAMHALIDLAREGLKRHEAGEALKAANSGKYSVV